MGGACGYVHITSIIIMMMMIIIKIIPVCEVLSDAFQSAK